MGNPSTTVLALVDNWTTFKDFYYNHGHQEVRFTNLVLDPGIKYRFVVKLCAKHICYEPQYSDGVRVLANPPTTGNIEVQHVTTANQERVIASYQFVLICMKKSFSYMYYCCISCIFHAFLNCSSM